MMPRPIGPVAVLGASNFPLAFSTAGGEIAPPLAADYPRAVKDHSDHPSTGDRVADAITAAVSRCNLPPGVFSLIQGGKCEVGQTLVQHRFIKAVTFIRTLGGERALFDLCATHTEPIPFFGEPGAGNPMVLLPSAHAARGAEIATGWAASLTMGGRSVVHQCWQRAPQPVQHHGAR